MLKVGFAKFWKRMKLRRAKRVPRWSVPRATMPRWTSGFSPMDVFFAKGFAKNTNITKWQILIYVQVIMA